ncbi:MAG: NADH:flavin oxidoreductase [Deltaproteobacteria bacterium]|nr:NADH:flavin oxidoreductase [Deltaproteobacteria bacterium]
MAYEKIFKPLKIGTCEIKNRIALAPMNTLYTIANNGLVNDQVLNYYAKRARGGIGLIITECVLATALASKFPYTTNLHLYHTGHLAGHEELVNVVHHFGAKIFIQLSIGFGRQGHALDGTPPPAPSPIPLEIKPENLPPSLAKLVLENMGLLATRREEQIPYEMTVEEIKNQIKEFQYSCLLAVIAGYDGIEIHAPHGYLEHQFFSPRSNKRTDLYGGSFENRARFTIEVFEAARLAVGPNFPLGIRLSANEHMEDGFTHEDMKRLVAILAAGNPMGSRRPGVGNNPIPIPGIDYLNISDGSYEAVKYFFPDEEAFHMLGEATSLKEVVKVPTICPSIHDPNNVEKVLKEDKIDMISLGRQTFADPDWVNKVKEGKKIKKCIRCNRCLLRTLQGLPVRCFINPETGFEKYDESLRMKIPKKSLIGLKIPDQFASLRG